MPGAAWLSASDTTSKTDGSALDISSVVCRLASKAILREMSVLLGLTARLFVFHLQRVAGEDRDHGAGDEDADGDGPQESTRALFAAACLPAVVVNRAVMVSWRPASVASRLV